MQEKKSVEKLTAITLTELYDTAYPPRKPVIENLLYSGTYLFAGSPKVGKSFLMAQIGYHVAAGLPLWGYEVHQGMVLYLALEDPYSRLQRRLSMMFGVEVENNEHYFLATAANTLQGGLIQQLEDFMSAHPNTNLVIVDTLQKIRAAEGEQCGYGKDYEVIGQLKSFADKAGICLLIVHHTRKMEAEDSFDTISGTNGLMGAADGAFVMKKKNRTDNEATLSMVGRDQNDQVLSLAFDRERCLWKLVDSAVEIPAAEPDPLLQEVADVLDKQNQHWRGTPSELLELLPGVQMTPNVLTRKLNVAVDRLYLEYGIRYTSGRTHTGRVIVLEGSDEKAL